MGGSYLSGPDRQLGLFEVRMNDGRILNLEDPDLIVNEADRQELLAQGIDPIAVQNRATGDIGAGAYGLSAPGVSLAPMYQGAGPRSYGAISPAALATAQGIQGTYVNPLGNMANTTAARQYALDPEMRAQLEYLDLVQRGQAGPSLAELQMQEGTDAAIRAQTAMGQSGPGWNPAQQAVAARQGEVLQRQNIRDTAQLRAQEQMAAREQYGGMLGMYGGQRLQQQAQTDVAAQDLRLLQKSYFDATQQIQQLEQQAQIEYDKMMAGQASDYNAVQGQLQAAYWQAQAAKRQMDAQEQAAWLSAAATVGAAAVTSLSDKREKEKLERVHAEEMADMQEALVSAQDQLIKQGRYAGLETTPVDERAAAWESRRVARETQPKGRYADIPPSNRSEREYRALQMGMTPEEYDRYAAQALGETEPLSFEYTPEATNRYGPEVAPRGRRYGMLAQHLEQTPAGAQAVVTGPGGVKSIDTQQLAIIDAMATGDHERRLRELERASPTYTFPAAQIRPRYGSRQRALEQSMHPFPEETIYGRAP